MKKLVSILLLLLFVYHGLAFYVFFLLARYEVRQTIKTQIKKGVPESELVIIEISPEDEKKGLIRWIEDHEFIYKNEMYDIVRLKKKGTTKVYYCINDHQEKVLMQNLDKQVQQFITTKTSSEKGKIKIIFQTDYFISSHSYTFSYFYSQIKFPFDKISLKEIPQKVLSPPPNVFLIT